MVLTEEAGRQPPVAFSRAYTAGAAAPTPIEAGEDKLTVTITARFELTRRAAQGKRQLVIAALGSSPGQAIQGSQCCPVNHVEAAWDRIIGNRKANRNSDNFFSYFRIRAIHLFTRRIVAAARAAPAGEKGMHDCDLRRSARGRRRGARFFLFESAITH